MIRAGRAATLDTAVPAVLRYIPVLDVAALPLLVVAALLP
jgi:hypothetical protein